VRALLDVNLVIALLDADHVFHERAHRWWAANARQGWASCPLTENGVVRVMSNSSYSAAARFAPAQLISRLRGFADQTDHEFWPDGLSLRDATVFDESRLHSSRLITDQYLLALAARHRGRLATFDQGIPLSAVQGATSAHLCVV